MSEISKNKQSKKWPKWVFLIPLIDFVLLLAFFLHGKNVALFNPQGLIAKQQHNLMIFSVAILLIVVIPTLALLFFIAWKYRDTNEKATFASKPQKQKSLVFAIWGLPTVVMLVLASVMWPTTHLLAPRRPIVHGTKPLTVQVVALRWKWLFIYPDQNIATVNYVQLPINTEVEFKLTGDEVPMSSFWIPNIGGQLYAMTGHVNRINLMPTVAGDFPGSSAEINGAGFAGMKFTTRVSSAQNFDDWVQEVKGSPNVLDASSYEALIEPSENNAAVYYSGYAPGLYDKVVLKYIGPEGHGH